MTVSAAAGSSWRAYGPDHPVVLEIGTMIEAGASYENIQRSLGVSRKTIVKYYGKSEYVRTYGRNGRALMKAHAERRRQTEERWREAARLRMEEGLRNSEIAARLGVSIGRVQATMGATPRRLGGAPYWDPGLHSRARYLREATDWSVEKIAEEMGVPRSTVSGWIRGMPCGNR